MMKISSRLTSYDKSWSMSLSSSVFRIRCRFYLGFLTDSVSFLFVFSFQFLINSFIKAYDLQGEGGGKRIGALSHGKVNTVSQKHSFFHVKSLS